MKRLLIVLSALVIANGFVAFAARPADAGAGGQCASAGVGFLIANDLIVPAAQGAIDYSTVADADDGPIFADLPEGTFLSLGTVVKLHTTNPELFLWCR